MRTMKPPPALCLMGKLIRTGKDAVQHDRLVDTGSIEYGK